ncbi:MAG: ABC transporter ATP-binding protein [Deltaproteobacteria bacterium]|nr:ABC transporter ATP-binding protein [Deltaproteobacteria bacterium]
MPPTVLRDTSPLLEVEDLVVQFKTDHGWVTAVDGISYTLRRSETLGIVGESGSGKSVTNLAVMRLLPTPPARIAGGRVRLRGEDLLAKSESQMRRLRGNTLAMIFQDPMTSLNPYLRIGSQLVEVVRLHQKKGAAEARRLALDMLARVGIPDPGRRFDSHPHELSGGMRQRVMIAMMLLNRPEVLIADEPTTALDVTIQAQILDLLRDLQKELGMSVTLITHDLGVVAGMTDRVIVMYGGRIMEEAPAASLYALPSHPYTIGLLASIPRPDKAVERLYSIPGRPPDLGQAPAGCAFAPRCQFVKDLCHQRVPELVDIGPGHRARCHFVVEVHKGRAAVGAARGAA